MAELRLKLIGQERPQTATPRLEALYGPEGARAQREQNPYGWKDELFLGFGDEARAGIGAASDTIRAFFKDIDGGFGDFYDERLGVAREQQRAYRDQNRVTSTVAQIGGGLLATPTGLATAIPTAGRAIMQGMGYGAAGGALAGFGEGEGAQNRVESAGVGAALGATVGAAIPAATDVVGRLARGVAYLKGLRGEGAKERARQMVVEAMAADGVSAADLARKAAGGKPVTIADLGPKTRELIGSSGRLGKAAGQTLEDFFETRTLGQFDRLSDDLAKAMKTDGRQFAWANDALKKARQENAAARYPAAYARGGVDLTDAAKEVLETPTGKSAVASATRAMADMGKRTTDDSGRYTVEFLDQVQRVLKDKAGAAKRGGKAEMAGRMDSLRGRFLETLPEEMRGAMAQYRADSDLVDALEAGRKFMRGDAEDVTGQVVQFNKQQADLFRLGVARELREKMGGRIDSGDISGMFQNPNIRERLSAVFPDEKSAKAFFDAVGDERTMQNTRNAVLKGSQTAGRRAADEMFQGDVLGGAVDMARGGLTWDMLLSRLGDANRRMQQGLNANVADEVARIGTTPGVAPTAADVAPRNLPRAVGAAGFAPGVAVGDVPGRVMGLRNEPEPPLYLRIVQ